MPNSVIFEVPPSPRHTSHIFLLAMCVFSSIPTFLGKASPPGSLQSVLPYSFVLIWAIVLTAGAVASLVGAFWRHKLTGLLIEQAGMLCVAVAAGYYFAILMKVIGLDSLQTSGLVFGFGVACAVRYRQIQKYFNQVKQARVEAATRTSLEEE